MKLQVSALKRKRHCLNSLAMSTRSEMRLSKNCKRSRASAERPPQGSMPFLRGRVEREIDELPVHFDHCPGLGNGCILRGNRHRGKLRGITGSCPSAFLLLWTVSV